MKILTLIFIIVLFINNVVISMKYEKQLSELEIENERLFEDLQFQESNVKHLRHIIEKLKEENNDY